MNSCACGLNLFANLLRFLVLSFTVQNFVATENLFLRKQLEGAFSDHLNGRETNHLCLDSAGLGLSRVPVLELRANPEIWFPDGH
jgi:hypothetical protein